MDRELPQRQYRPSGVRNMTYLLGFLGAIHAIVSWFILFRQPDVDSLPIYNDFINYSLVPLPPWIVELILWRSVSAFYFLLAWGFWTMKRWAYWITALIFIVSFVEAVISNITPLVLEMPADFLDFLSGFLNFLASITGLILPGYFVWEVLRRSTREAFFKKDSYPYPHSTS